MLAVPLQYQGRLNEVLLLIINGGVLFLGGVRIDGEGLIYGVVLFLGGRACSDSVCPSAVPGVAEGGAAVGH